jgi:hypothetical protein
MKISNKIKNNFWILNWAPISMLVLSIIFLFVAVNAALTLIDILTSNI